MTIPDPAVMNDRMNLALQSFAMLQSCGGRYVDVVFTTANLVDRDTPVVVVGFRPRQGHPMWEPGHDEHDVIPVAAFFNDDLAAAICPYEGGVSIPVAQLAIADDEKPFAMCEVVDTATVGDDVEEFLRRLS